MKLISLAILMVSITAAAQTAKVVQLSPDDAAQAKSLAEQRKSLEEKQVAFNEHIVNKYLIAGPKEDSSCSITGRNIRSGWNCGEFIFSEDFKFIVPNTAPKYNLVPPSNWMPGTLTVGPA